MKPTQADERLSRDLSFISLAGLLGDNEHTNLTRSRHFKDQYGQETKFSLIAHVTKESIGHYSIISTLCYNEQEIFQCKYIDFMYDYNELLKLDDTEKIKHLNDHVNKKPSLFKRMNNDVFDRLDKAYRHEVLYCDYEICSTLKRYVEYAKIGEINKLVGIRDIILPNKEKQYIVNEKR